VKFFRDSDELPQQFAVQHENETRKPVAEMAVAPAADAAPDKDNKYLTGSENIYWTCGQTAT
jgi:hypothetical protein